MSKDCTRCLFHPFRQNSLAAGKYKKYFQNPEGVKKEYLALVDGIFPKG